MRIYNCIYLLTLIKKLATVLMMTTPRHTILSHRMMKLMSVPGVKSHCYNNQQIFTILL